MAKELVKLGHPVKVYASCGVKGEGVYEGVEYYTTDKYHDLSCDILIVSRQASAVSDNFNIKAKKKILWCHDTIPLAFNEQLNNKFDYIFALSNSSAIHTLLMFDIYPCGQLDIQSF
jgi:hypothetical protein